MTGEQQTWTEVDDYLDATLGLGDATLAAAQAAAAAAGLPDISITATQGRCLQLLARLCAAQNVLEIGTLGGYSAIWLGRALPPAGRLLSLEIDPKHAAVARSNLAAAGLAGSCEVRVGAALDLLPQLAATRPAPFDLVFIDADKPSIPDYFRWALELVRPGGLIVVDNVVRKGALRDPASTDPSVIGVRRLTEMLAAEPRVSATVLQTVGRKGYDGWALAYVLPGR